MCVLEEKEQKLTKIPQLSGKEESTKATERQMSKDEASLIADKIVYLFRLN